jgi:hypothetical protein
MFRTKLVEKIKTRFVFAYFFSKFKIKVEKYCRAGQATDDNMAYFMLDT